MAAAVLTSVIYNLNTSSEIITFAQKIEKTKAGNSTRIILQNGEEIQVDKTQSQINYDSKGENITINSDQKITQKIQDKTSDYNTIIVPYGKRSQITLPEGTKVWLNSGSKMVYPAVFAQNKREVYIDGEAIFEVTHMASKPFVVSTREFEINVLGTVFDVSAYSDDKYSSTVLERGKIELFCRGTSLLSRKKQILLPGTMAVFDPDQHQFEQQKVNPQKYLSWREGYLILNSEKLENILKKLARYYNIEMVITDNKLKNETFSGYLDLKNSPEEVLSIINETNSLSYTVNSEKIFINPK